MPRFFGHKQGVDALVRTVLRLRRPRHRVPHRVRVLVGELEAADRGGLGPDGPGAGGGLEVPRQARRRRRAHPHRRRPQRRSPTSCAPAWQQAEDSTARQHPHHAVGRASTTAAAGTSSRPAARRCAAGVPPSELDEAPAQRATWRSATRPIPISSSAPAARCASATSCSGRRRTPSSSSPIACGPSSASAELDAALAEYARPRAALRRACRRRRRSPRAAGG